MAKLVDKTESVWYEQDGETTRIGFTPKTLEKMECCFHIVPAKRRTMVRANAPLMAIETGEGLFSIPSPVSGIIALFDNKALNFPDQLTEDDVICTISAKAKKEEKIVDTYGWQQAPQPQEVFELNIETEEQRQARRQLERERLRQQQADAVQRIFGGDALQEARRAFEEVVARPIEQRPQARVRVNPPAQQGPAPRGQRRG